MIVACMVLHNILIDLGDITAQDETNEVDVDISGSERSYHIENVTADDNVERRVGRARRALFTKLFYSKAMESKRSRPSLVATTFD
jgi:hypothetical protein